MGAPLFYARSCTKYCAHRGHGPSRVLQPQASGQTSLVTVTHTASTFVSLVFVVFRSLLATQWQTPRRKKRQRNLQLPRRGYVASGNPCSIISPAASQWTDHFLSSSNSRNRRRRVRKLLRRRRKRTHRQPRKSQLSHQPPRSPTQPKMLKSKKNRISPMRQMKRTREHMSRRGFCPSLRTIASPP